MTSPAAEHGAGPAPPALAAAPPSAVGLHGAISAFNPAQEEWDEYIEHLQHYFTANDILAEDKRRAILLTAVGPSTYRLIRTLVVPAKVTEVSFDEIVAKAKAHFCPKPSPIVKRFEFTARRQGEDESIAMYIAELRRIAEYCDYGAVLSDMLRDRLVCGVRDKSIQRRLLQTPDLTFNKAHEVALAAEAAEKDSKRLMVSAHGDQDHAIPVGQVKSLPSHAGWGKGDRDRTRRPEKPSNSGEQSHNHNSTGKHCSRCGGWHEPTHCTYKNYECHYCKKKGHLGKMCRKKSRPREQKTHHVTEEEPASQEEEEVRGDFSMYHVTANSPSSPFQVTVTGNGRPLLMEIDTGASVSIASLHTFESLREGESTLELREPNVRLQTYTGESIKVCGHTEVQVTHNGQTRSLPLVITQGDGPTLLGRNWLEALQLDWHTIFRVGNNLFTLHEVLSQHADVFKDELGELRGVKATLHVNANARPRFVKARSPGERKWSRNWSDCYRWG